MTCLCAVASKNKRPVTVVCWCVNRGVSASWECLMSSIHFGGKCNKELKLIRGNQATALLTFGDLTIHGRPVSEGIRVDGG